MHVKIKFLPFSPKQHSLFISFHETNSWGWAFSFRRILLVSSCLLEEFASCFANVQSCLSLMITDVGIWQANEIPTITFDLVDQDLYGNSTFKWTNIANSLQIVQNKCSKFRKLLLFVVRHCLFTFYKTENVSLWLSLLTNFIVYQFRRFWSFFSDLLKILPHFRWFIVYRWLSLEKISQSKQKDKTTIWSSKKFKIKWRDRLENEIIECFGEVGGIVSCPFECHSLLNLMALSSWPTKVMYYHLFAIKILKIEKKDI